MQEADAVRAAGVDAAARSRAIAVEGDKEGPIKSGSEEGVGGMRVVVVKAAQLLIQPKFRQAGEQFVRVLMVLGGGYLDPLMERPAMHAPVEPGRSRGPAVNGSLQPRLARHEFGLLGRQPGNALRSVHHVT